MKEKMGDKQRLLHILEAISEIEQYVKDAGVEEFFSNSMMRFASIKQIEIIGEAANYISPETKTSFHTIEWNQITGMRHILVHEYFGVDAQLIWQVIINDLPGLKIKVNQILQTL